MSARSRRGFSLLEVLVALALSALVGLVAARGLSAARRAVRGTAQASDAALSLDLGSALLEREVRRAGYVPYPAPPAGDAAVTPGLGLAVHTRSPQGDSLEVRYLDDRVVDGPVARDLRFEVGVDGRGLPQLYRATAAGSKQPLVEGVTGLRVSGWGDASGLHAGSDLGAGSLRPWFLVLRLTAAGAPSARTVVVPLPSRPLTTVGVGP